jgi:hypothetical protein
MDRDVTAKTARLVVEMDESLAEQLRESGQLKIISRARSGSAEITWSSSPSLPVFSAVFAWLVKRNDAEGALATIHQDIEIYHDTLFHWIVFPQAELELGVRRIANEIRGAADSIRSAKHQCEKILGLRLSPNDSAH